MLFGFQVQAHGVVCAILGLSWQLGGHAFVLILIMVMDGSRGIDDDAEDWLRELIQYNRQAWFTIMHSFVHCPI